MQRIFRLLIVLLPVFCAATSQAQYCGSSGTSVCTPTGQPYAGPGYYPPPDSFAPLENNFLTNTALEFRLWDSIIFGTQILYVYSITLDSVENLPSGLCWSANSPNNAYNPGDTGCMAFSGLPCDATGQYKLRTIVTVDIGVPVQTDGDPGGLIFFVRLKNPGDDDTPVDSTQTYDNPFIAYGGSCAVLVPPVVNLGPDQTVCAGSIATLSADVSGGQPPYTYFWQSTGSNIICPTCVNPDITVTENTSIILKITDASGASAADTLNITASGTPYNFEITSAGQNVFCTGGTVTLQAAPNDSLTYQWTYNGVNISGATSNSLTVTDSSGSYNCLYSEAGVCRATSNFINLIFFDTTSAAISVLGPDTLCVGEVTVLQTSIGPGLSYVWLLNDSINLNTNSASILIDTGGSYQVIITNTVPCSDTSSSVIIIGSDNLPTEITFVTYIGDTVCNNSGSITLSGADPPGGTYTGTGVSNNIFYPNQAVAGNNFITYNYTDSNACRSSATDTVFVVICTAVQNLSLNDIKLYPNPATDYVSIQSDLFQSDITLEMFDIAGKTVLGPLKYTQASGKILLNVQTLAGGMYWINLYIHGQQFYKRFVKI